MRDDRINYVLVGGFGLRRDIRVLHDGAVLSVLSEKNMLPPAGVDGGGSGAGNRFTVARNDEVIEPSPSQRAPPRGDSSKHSRPPSGVTRRTTPSTG